MRRFAMTCASLALATVQGAGAQALDSPPPWAYPVNPPDLALAPDDGAARRVPGSDASYTLTQVRDIFLAPDWYPAERPSMPDVVAKGRRPDVPACGSCHRATGTGGPENANLTGLPFAYIVQQVGEFGSGTRRSSAHQRAPVVLMEKVAKNVTDEELKAAARYFASFAFQPVVRVVESTRVPATRVMGWHLTALGTGEQEPIGMRIIELAEDHDRFISRDPKVDFIAHVPPGSIERGRALATGTRGTVAACTVCHGPNLQGLGPVPGIGGRSPTYLFRQLFDFRTGSRKGASSPLMEPVVQTLSLEDMVALAAYVASVR